MNRSVTRAVGKQTSELTLAAKTPSSGYRSLCSGSAGPLKLRTTHRTSTSTGKAPHWEQMDNSVKSSRQRLPISLKTRVTIDLSQTYCERPFALHYCDPRFCDSRTVISEMPLVLRPSAASKKSKDGQDKIIRFSSSSDSITAAD